MNVDFGDGTSETRVVTNTVSSPAAVVFPHSFPFSRLENNTYTVTATLANGVSNLTLSGELIFEEPIQSLLAAVHPEVVPLGDDVALAAELDTFSVVHLTIRWGDGNASYVTQTVNDSTEVFASHVYQDEGDFSVELTAANAVSEMNFAIPETVVVRRNLTGKLNLSNEEFVNIQTGATVDVVSLDGLFSDVTCLWTFGANSGTSRANVSPASPMSISLDTSGLSPGSQVFTANCSNAASSAVLSAVLRLVSPIGDVSLELSSDSCPSGKSAIRSMSRRYSARRTG